MSNSSLFIFLRLSSIKCDFYGIMRGLGGGVILKMPLNPMYLFVYAGKLQRVTMEGKVTSQNVEFS